MLFHSILKKEHYLLIFRGAKKSTFTTGNYPACH